MSYKLLIVESPSKAKTINKYLGDEYVVRASVGHVRDLPKNNKKAIDIEKGFIPHYEISPGKEKVIEEIESLAKKAEEVLLATDPDREGEAIAWHIKEAVGLKKPKRVVFHEITKDAILEALKHPRVIDENLRKAQEARRVLDRLVGYDLSGIIWKKVRYGLSAGRVQSPALRIIMEREREIRAFAPEDFFVISGNFKTEQKQTLALTCELEPKTKSEADQILVKAKKESWLIESVTKTEVKRSAKAPFTTSTLQQTASTRLGFSPSNTMRIAQKLYEAGHITYMRTDSTNLGTFAIQNVKEIVIKQYGEKYYETHTFSAKSKNAQEAHEAIRPTHAEKLSSGANEDEKKLYALIWARTVASQMTDAKLERTKITANTETKSVPNFSTTGSTIIFDGWLKADPDATGEENVLPKVTAKETLDLLDIDALAKQTQPPSRYTEAGLIKELEKRGIGRPSTYASIIRTLEEREYVTKQGKTMFPTDTGDVVSTFLEQNFEHYISDTFTAEMEDKLDDIANGDAEYETTLKKFYTPFLKEVKEKDKLDKATTFGVADPKFKCPKCKSGMLVKLSRGGKFLSCDKYPECDGALTIEGLEIKADEPIGIDPASSLPIFVKTGRFGPYVQLGEMPARGIKAPKVKKTKEEKAKGKEQKLLGIKVEKPTTLKPRMASIPKEYDPTNITLENALRFLSLPRTLGSEPTTGLPVTANAGRFGPYVAHNANYRSIKLPLNPYDITFEEALHLLAQEKKPRGFQKSSQNKDSLK